LSRYTLNQVSQFVDEDNVLIRGWGAARYSGIRGILCVRVCAPMAERVRVMMERLAMKDAEATWQEIERFDAANSRAMRASFNFDWNDALLLSRRIELCAGASRRLRQGRLRTGKGAAIPGRHGDKVSACRQTAGDEGSRSPCRTYRQR